VDCIILLHGPEFELREKEALRLTGNGLGKVTFYPLINHVRISFFNDCNQKIQKPQKAETNYWELRKHKNNRYLENTHIELLVARSFVQNNRMKRIAIVSSPYHMRRVKLIADRLFKDEVERYYSAPGNYTSSRVWIFNWREIKWASKESLKLLWFLFYWHFLPSVLTEFQ
jgi:hypothetical protein